MTTALTDTRARELIDTAHRDGITDLQIAAIIEHEHHIYLRRRTTRPFIWTLPSTSVLPGMTVNDTLTELLDTLDPDATADFLDAAPDPGEQALHFVFAITTPDPTTILPPRWPDTQWLDCGQRLTGEIEPNSRAILERHYGMTTLCPMACHLRER